MKLHFPKRAFAIFGRVTVVGVSLIALVLTIAWLSGMFEPKIAPDWSDRGVRKYSDEPTDVVHEVNRAYTEEAVGTLKASSRTVISSKILAAIDSITVTAGDEVTAGQELIRLADQEFQARIDQAKQALVAAKARRQEAEQQFARGQEMVAQQVISRTDFDRISRDLQVAKADELRAEQAVSEAAAMLSYTTIMAPKNGRVVDRLAEPGDTARPGEPLLILYDATSLRLEAPVMEQLALSLKAGDQVLVYIDAQNREYAATVDEKVPQADAPSRSFLVKASLPKSDELYEGMFGRLRIPVGDRRHLCLATDAVVRIGQLEFVDVVLPDKTLERRLIKCGQLGMPGRQEVLSGLEAGERVILHKPAPKVPEGSGATDGTLGSDVADEATVPETDSTRTEGETGER